MANPWDNDAIISPEARQQVAEMGRQPTDLGTLRPDDAVQVSKAPWDADKIVKEGPPTSFAGVDFTKPIHEVRASIDKLPPATRKAALNAWADHYVTNDANQTGDAIDDHLRAFARGAPIGSWLDELNAVTASGLHNISGGAMGAPYDESVAYQRARDRKFDASNPKTAMGLKIAGGVATAALAPTAPIVGTATLAGRAANGLANGLAYGTLYGSGEGEDTAGRVENAIKGAAIGGAVGAAAAPIATGASNVLKYAADKYKGIPAPLQQYSRGGIDRVQRGMADDQLFARNGGPPPTRGGYQQQAQELGQEGMLADMGPNLLSQVKGITTQPGEGQRILKGAIEQRARGARGRIDNDVTAALGPPRNLVQAEEQAVRAANQAAAPHYQAFYNTQINARDMQQLIPLLHRVPPAVWNKAQELASFEGVNLAQSINTGRGLDLIKRGLDDIARNADRGSNLQRLASTLARDLRSTTDRILSPRDPAMSSWAQARRASGEGMQFREGVEQGASAFQRGTHPDQMAADLARMPNVQRTGYREGARGAIRDTMGNAASAGQSPADGLAAATAARKALGSEYARDKMAQVTGDPARAARLSNRLDAETRFANTRNQAYMGTETAARTAAQKEFPNAATRREAATEMGKLGVQGIAIKGLYRFVNAALGGHLDERQARIATDAAYMLAAQGANRDMIARALMSYGQGRAITSAMRDNINRIAQKLIETAARAPAIDAASRKSAGQRR